VANLRELPYIDYLKFVEYNIKDVLLQLGIYRKTNDMSDLYNRCYTNGLLANEIFTSTAMLIGSISIRFYEYGYILGNNANKLELPSLKVNDMVQFADNDVDEIVENEDDVEFGKDDENDISESADFVEGADEEEDESYADEAVASETATEDANGKKKKFSGALVSNPIRMSPSGFKIMGKDSKYVHDYVIDGDIVSEYPTSIILMNLSNETMVGKVFIKDEDDIAIPFYNYEFADVEERVKYDKLNKAALFLEMMTQGETMNLMSIYFNMPSFSELCNMLEEENVV
jgi:hypothetical protein